MCKAPKDRALRCLSRRCSDPGAFLSKSGVVFRSCSRAPVWNYRADPTAKDLPTNTAPWSSSATLFQTYKNRSSRCETHLVLQGSCGLAWSRGGKCKGSRWIRTPLLDVHTTLFWHSFARMSFRFALSVDLERTSRGGHGGDCRSEVVGGPRLSRVPWKRTSTGPQMHNIKVTLGNSRTDFSQNSPICKINPVNEIKLNNNKTLTAKRGSPVAGSRETL